MPISESLPMLNHWPELAWASWRSVAAALPAAASASRSAALVVSRLLAAVCR